MQQAIVISSNSYSLTPNETLEFYTHLEKGDIIVTGFECDLEMCFANLQDVEVFRTYFHEAKFPADQIVISDDHTEGVKAVWELAFPTTVRSEKDIINLYYEIEDELNVDDYFDLNVNLRLVLYHSKDTFPCKPYYVKPLPTVQLPINTYEQNSSKVSVNMIQEIRISDASSDQHDIWLHHITTFLGRLDKQPISVEVDINKIILTWDIKNKGYAEQLYAYLKLQS